MGKRPSIFLVIVALWTGINTTFYFMLVPFRIAMSRDEEIAIWGNDWLGTASDFYVAFLWLVLAVMRMSDAVVKRNV